MAAQDSRLKRPVVVDGAGTRYEVVAAQTTFYVRREDSMDVPFAIPEHTLRDLKVDPGSLAVAMASLKGTDEPSSPRRGRGRPSTEGIDDA